MSRNESTMTVDERGSLADGFVLGASDSKKEKDNPEESEQSRKKQSREIGNKGESAKVNKKKNTKKRLEQLSEKEGEAESNVQGHA